MPRVDRAGNKLSMFGNVGYFSWYIGANTALWVITETRGTAITETRGTVITETRGTVITETRGTVITETRGPVLTLKSFFLWQLVTPNPQGKIS